MISLLREVGSSARSKPAQSALSILLAAAVCGIVILTAGRTIGARQAALNQIDSLATRTIVFKIAPDAGVRPDVLRRIDQLDQVGSSLALSGPLDVRNAALADSNPVPARYLWPPAVVNVKGAYARAETLHTLQMSGPTGSIALDSGQQFQVSSVSHLPALLARFEPLVLLPTSGLPNPTSAVTVIIVVARDAAVVPDLAQATLSLIGVSDPAKVQVSTSTDLALLRDSLSDELGSFGRALVLVLFAVTAALTTCVLFAVVTMQRKDFGRRRALGATRLYVVSLVCGQSVLTSSIGVAISVSACLIYLAVTRVPLPPTTFVIAVAFLSVVAGLVGAFVPAVYAAHRDPVKELRVP